ncbi:hypothetical protein K388_07382 [Streptomyces sp. KhCrAH-43]|uniref:hypothetical protein n=1 Tax=unclassified Streptomyces TaxID=2593676 RepID=UPI000363DA11|nr:MULTISPECIES: hypothetical protein [unclassified Streptomyces]MYS36354.1 hypothetical protein [Streptomyces sp. SID4920]MYX64009.1 hypothetical protein [Streptomyces sp. SID8373]RAJ44297.1 hypothetical protein K388_07382 [Streptomyces sp. KhCrAH-43]
MTPCVQAPSVTSITALLATAGHQPVTTRADGFTLRPTADQAALVLTYWCEPRDAHEHLTGGHIHRRRRMLLECASLISDAGHQAARTPTVQEPGGRAAVESLVIFPAPEREPEPELADPACCSCTSAEVCTRAELRAIAAGGLDQATAAARTALLDALHESSVEPVNHAAGGPEGVAALLDCSRDILATLPPAPDESAVRADLECQGCNSAACLASNQLARAALERAAALAAVKTVALAAARTILDRAHLAVTPGDRWHSARKAAAEQLSRVHFTAATALTVPADETHGRYRGARRRRGPAVNLRKGRTRYWFVRWGSAAWH